MNITDISFDISPPKVSFFLVAYHVHDSLNVK